MCVGDACCLAGGGVFPSLQILHICSDHMLISCTGLLVSVLTSLALESSQSGGNCVWLLLFAATPWGSVAILSGIASTWLLPSWIWELLPWGAWALARVLVPYPELSHLNGYLWQRSQPPVWPGAGEKEQLEMGYEGDSFSLWMFQAIARLWEWFFSQAATENQTLLCPRV